MARFEIGTHVKEHKMHKASVGRVVENVLIGNYRFIVIEHYDGTVQTYPEDMVFVRASPSDIKLGLAIAARPKTLETA